MDMDDDLGTGMPSPQEEQYQGDMSQDMVPELPVQMRQDSTASKRREERKSGDQSDDQAPKRRRVARAAASSSSSKATGSGYAPRVAVDDEYYDKGKKFIKKHRPRAMTEEEKLDIIALQLYFRHEQHKQKGRAGRPKKYKHDATIAKMLRRGKDTVGKVWKDYAMESTVHVNDLPGNREKPPTRVPRTNKVSSAIQEFVRERRKTRIRTVARDVLAFLKQKQYIDYDEDVPKGYKAALRSVQRLLKELGYKRGKKKNAVTYRMREENVIKRDKYVMCMTDEDELKGRRVVYMDESYIHKNYSRHEDSLYDPNDEQDLQVKAQHKGQRYCFIAAIVDADHTVPEAKCEPYQQAHLMHDTVDIFQGGKKQTKDYHGMFNHQYFVEWMKKLLLALEARGIKNAIIVMDNAKYHKKLPEDTPRSTQKKEVLVEACKKYGLPLAKKETKATLWEKLSPHVKMNVLPVIVKMAKDAGHEVLFSPPHHSDLQPIELIWAIVKGEVGRQYTTDTTFKQVLERLNAAFQHVESKTVAGCIRKANKKLKELLEYIEGTEDIDDDDPDEDNDEKEANEDGNDESDEEDDESDEEEDESDEGNDD